MTYYSILDVTPTNDAWVEDYLPNANRLVAKHGGKYLARTASHEQVEGKTGAEVGLRILLEWPSKEAAMAFMNDPEYTPYLKARSGGSVSNHYLVEARDDLS